ncbi:MAG: hypothetical protein ACM3ZT_03840 [Bacillota bacterium]
MAAVEQGKQQRLPSYVQDVTSASCVFCPYGADVKVGQRVYAYDEKTSLSRRQRERLVEVTAVKIFRSNGRLVTLDLEVAPQALVERIAEDSEMSVPSLVNHHAGSATYDTGHPPVVVFFRPCDEGDTLLGPGEPRPAQAQGWRRLVGR